MRALCLVLSEELHTGLVGVSGWGLYTAWQVHEHTMSAGAAAAEQARLAEAQHKDQVSTPSQRHQHRALCSSHAPEALLAVPDLGATDWRGCTADRPTWFASMSTLTAPDQQAGFGHSSLSIRFDIVIGFKLSRHAPCVSSYPSTFPLHPVYNQRPLSLTSSRRHLAWPSSLRPLMLLLPLPSHPPLFA